MTNTPTNTDDFYEMPDITETLHSSKSDVVCLSVSVCISKSSSLHARVRVCTTIQIRLKIHVHT